MPGPISHPDSVPIDRKKDAFVEAEYGSLGKSVKIQRTTRSRLDFPRLHHITRSGEGQRPTDRSLFMPLALSLSLPLLFTSPLAGNL